MSPPRAIRVIDDATGASQTVTLAYDDRYRRRRAMVADNGFAFLLDLPQAVEMGIGQALELEDGRRIAVRAADEDLLVAEAPDAHALVRAAWHVGNRHLPCAIATDRLTLRWDHVIAEMLEGLGCSVRRASGPFQPERGAYGHGRTQGHDHSHSHSHEHTHAPDHGHDRSS